MFCRQLSPVVAVVVDVDIVLNIFVYMSMLNSQSHMSDSSHVENKTVPVLNLIGGQKTQIAIVGTMSA